MSNVMYVVKKLEPTLNEIHNILTPNGQLIYIEPPYKSIYYDSIFGCFSQWWPSSDICMKQEKWLKLLNQCNYRDTVISGNDNLVFLIQTRKPTINEIISDKSASLDQFNSFNNIILFNSNNNNNDNSFSSNIQNSIRSNQELKHKIVNINNFNRGLQIIIKTKIVAIIKLKELGAVELGVDLILNTLSSEFMDSNFQCLNLSGRIADLSITHLTPNDYMTNDHYKFNMGYNNVELVDFSSKLFRSYLKKIIKDNTIKFHFNQIDIEDSNKVNQVLNQLEVNENIRNIDSIIHFAFMNDIGEVQQVDMNRLNNAHGAKTIGAINLHNESINRSWNIKQFIMASSVVSIFGSDKQSISTLKFVNVNNVKEIIKLSVSNINTQKLIVHFSSLSIFIGHQFTDGEDFEETNFVPNFNSTPIGYIQSKVIAEKLLTNAAESRGILSIIIRPPDIFSNPITGIGHSNDFFSHNKQDLEINESIILNNIITITK
ncbi:hypothetical protein ACTFIV_008090 [Dictyostelium citrinum]